MHTSQKTGPLSHATVPLMDSARNDTQCINLKKVNECGRTLKSEVIFFRKVNKCPSRVSLSTLEDVVQYMRYKHHSESSCKLSLQVGIMLHSVL